MKPNHKLGDIELKLSGESAQIIKNLTEALNNLAAELKQKNAKSIDKN